MNLYRQKFIARFLSNPLFGILPVSPDNMLDCWISSTRNPIQTIRVDILCRKKRALKASAPRWHHAGTYFRIYCLPLVFVTLDQKLYIYYTHHSNLKAPPSFLLQEWIMVKVEQNCNEWQDLKNKKCVRIFPHFACAWSALLVFNVVFLHSQK